MNAFRFDEGEVRERAAQLLLRDPPSGYRRSDDDLNPGSPMNPSPGLPMAASVLVPIVAHTPEVTVLLTLRTETLASHPGQVSFPGGRKADADEDAATTALRETEEETGLSRSRVELIGYLDAYLTRTNYRIVPVVGMVAPGFSLAPAAEEVAAVFEVPLRFLMTAQNHLIHSREWKGASRKFYAMPYENRYIWGATAGMLRSFYERMYAEGGTT